MESGHGKYMYDCGLHMVRQCRCPHSPEQIYKTSEKCPTCATPPLDSLEKWAGETYEALQFLYREPETHSLSAEGLESLLARARALGVGK